MENKIHITLGDNIGQLLTNIAREKLLYSFDVKGAIDTIQQSLMGCPYEIAVGVIKGDILIFTSDDHQSVYTETCTPELEEDFAKLDIKEWAEMRNEQMLEDGEEWYKCLEQIINNVIGSDEKIDFSVSYQQLMKYIDSGDPSEIFIDDARIQTIIYAVKGARKYIDDSLKILNVLRWMFRTYPNEIDEDMTLEPSVLGLLYSRLTALTSGESDSFFKGVVNTGDDLLDTWLENEREISSKLEKGLKPENIADKFDAGWLAPSGDYYALNGTTANLLHNQIADALREQGIIPDLLGTEYENNPDLWLERNGWAKIHGTQILFSGYEQPLFKRPLIRLTEIQIEKIIAFGEFRCPGGVMHIGYNNKPVNVIKFKQMDDIAIGNLFHS